jgi:hypothetical protein
MTFLAPGYLLASLAIAAAIAALHFILVRQPRAGILPTARFIPDSQAKAVAAARRPSDIAVMLLRMLTIIAAGAALAKPVLTPSRRPTARVILADVSRSAKDTAALRDSVRAVYRDGDALVFFDSAARLVVGNIGDSVSALHAGLTRGNLGAALIAALRSGSTLRDRADSLELVIISPFAREELDAATDSIRKLWPGRARLVAIGGAGPDTATASGTLEIEAAADDPLAVTVPISRHVVRGNALITRGPRFASAGVARSGADGSAGVGQILIEWPAAGRPPFAVPRARSDTASGVIVGDHGVVAPFARRWSFPPDSLRGAEVIGRWYDGEPAAIEKPEGTACVRSVAIPVTPVGDLVIRSDWAHLVAELSRPCAAVTSLVRADPSDIAPLTGAGGLASRDAFEPVTNTRSTLAPWLFGLAVAAAIAELFLRKRRVKPHDAAEDGTPSRVPHPPSRLKTA